MARSRGNVPAVQGRAYPDLADLERRASEILSAPQVPPTALRELYTQYVDVLREVNRVTLLLYGRAKDDFLERLRDLTALQEILDNPVDSTVRVVQVQQAIEPTPQRTFPLPGDTVDARVEKYSGRIDPKVFKRAQLWIGQYVSGNEIRSIAGYEKPEFYERVRKGNVPTKGARAGKRYLIDDSTILALFGKNIEAVENAKVVHVEESVDDLAAKYEGQISPRALAKIRPLMGQYVSGPTIRAITGYDAHVLWDRAKKGEVPTTGTRGSKKYLINESTVMTLFGKNPRANVVTNEDVRGHESVNEATARYEGQIDSKGLSRINGLIGTYADAGTIRSITGYNHKTLQDIVKRNKIPTQGTTMWSLRIFINEQTIPILFGKNYATVTSAEIPRKPKLEGIWMTQKRIAREFGYSRSDEVYPILRAHPEIERRGETKRGAKTTLYRITPENRGLFDRVDGKSTVATARGKGSSTLEQDDFSPATRSIGTKLKPAPRRVPDPTGETLTYDEFIDYFNEQFGDKGPAIVLEILEKHGDDVQKGDNRFDKKKLDEILAEHQAK